MLARPAYSTSRLRNVLTVTASTFLILNSKVKMRALERITTYVISVLSTQCVLQ